MALNSTSPSALKCEYASGLFRVLGESLVELGVLFLFHFVRASEPDRLDVVEAFPIPNGLGHGLRLRFVVLFVFVAFLIVAFLVVVGVVTGDVSFFILVAASTGTSSGTSLELYR